MVPRPESSGKFLEMEILGPCFRLIESEILGVGPEICISTNPAEDFDIHSSLRRTTEIIQMGFHYLTVIQSRVFQYKRLLQGGIGLAKKSIWFFHKIKDTFFHFHQ